MHSTLEGYHNAVWKAFLNILGVAQHNWGRKEHQSTLFRRMLAFLTLSTWAKNFLVNMGGGTIRPTSNTFHT